MATRAWKACVRPPQACSRGRRACWGRSPAAGCELRRRVGSSGEASAPRATSHQLLRRRPLRPRALAVAWGRGVGPSEGGRRHRGRMGTQGTDRDAEGGRGHRGWTATQTTDGDAEGGWRHRGWTATWDGQGHKAWTGTPLHGSGQRRWESPRIQPVDRTGHWTRVPERRADRNLAGQRLSRGSRVTAASPAWRLEAGDRVSRSRHASLGGQSRPVRGTSARPGQRCARWGPPPYRGNHAAASRVLRLAFPHLPLSASTRPRVKDTTTVSAIGAAVRPFLGKAARAPPFAERCHPFVPGTLSAGVRKWAMGLGTE